MSALKEECGTGFMHTEISGGLPRPEKAAESGKPHVRKRIHYFTPPTDKLTDIRKKYCRIDNRREKNMTGKEQETPAAMPQPDTGETAVGKYGIAKEDGQI